MNKIYKVIFNSAKGQYEVVSEIARNCRKSSQSSFSGTSFRFLGITVRNILLGLFLLGSSCAADAATVNNGDNLAGGSNITVTKDDTTKTITISASGLAKTTELDSVKSDVDKNKKDIGENKTAIGTINTTIGGHKTQIQTNTTGIATNKSDIAANKANVEKNTKDIATNAGNIATNKTNVEKNANAITALQETNKALGLDKNKPGIKYFRANSTGLDAFATGVDAIAIGKDSKASKDKAISIGLQAEASAAGAVAIGAETRTKNPRGKGAEAAAENAVAIGADSEVVSQGESGIALGHGAITGTRPGMLDDGTQVSILGGGVKSISIGNKANARGNSSIALGDGAVVMNDPNNTTGTLVDGSIAIGKTSKTSSTNAIAIGAGASVKYGSTGATAIGTGANAVSGNSFAAGSGASATNIDSLAIGSGAKASERESISIGKEAAAAGVYAIALGGGTSANADKVISIGHGAKADAEYSVVIGDEAGIGMVGDKNHVNGTHIVIGKEAGQNIDGAENISMGNSAGSNVKGNYNIAIGSGAGTYIGDKTASSAQNSLAGYNVSLGYQANYYTAYTSIASATALGSKTVANTQGTAVGADAKATGNGSTALGYTSLSEGEKSMALGEQSKASGEGNVAIGGGTLATALMAQGNAYLTGTTAKQVVSVGNGNLMSDYGRRRIVNVADGSADQDAVTVLQLKTLKNNLESQIKNAQPGGSSSGNAVTYSGTNNEYVNLQDKNGEAVQIKNIKDGADDRDAVNKGQLDKAVDTAKVHYYSIKTDDTGTTKNNYHNDGASGPDSMAMGIIAKATQERSVAVGNHVTAEGTASIAIGVGYKNDDGSISETKAETGYTYNTAIGAGAQSAGNDSLAIGTRAATKQQNGADPNSSKESVAIGYQAETSNIRGVALGAEAKSVGKGSNAIGDRAQASGTDSIALGTNAVDLNSNNSIAMGTGATVTKGSSASVIGNGANASNAVNANILGTGNAITNGKEDNNLKDTSLIGNSNNITRNDAQYVTNVIVSGNSNTVQGVTDPDAETDAKYLDKISITGTKNKVILEDNTLPVEDVTIMGNDNTVKGAPYDPTGIPNLSHIQILGSGVTATVGNSVYLGTGSAAAYKATAQTAGADSYNDSYAVATKAAGVVTIGSKGAERRLQNMAAGLVAKESTDAVNGSQLYYRTLPLRFGGDNSKVGATTDQDVNMLKRRFDEAMRILGGADGKNLSDNNIGVVADKDKNEINVKLAKDVKGLNSVEATTVNSTTVNATTVKTGDTVITTDGLTINNGPSITKTGGINANNTVITNVKAGKNDTDAVNVSQLKQAVQASATKIEAGKNVTVTSMNNEGKGPTTYTINADLSSVATALGGKSKVDEKTGKVEADLTINEKTYTNVEDAINASNTTVSSKNGSVTVTKTSNDNGSNNFDLSVDYGTIAKNTTISYKANGINEKTVSLDKGFDFTNGDNTTASVGDNGIVKYDLNKDISLDSVKTGDTVINNTGLTVGGKTYVTKDGIDANDKKVVHVADGEISETSKDAVNGSQLHVTDVKVDNNTKNIQTNTDNINKGLNFAADSGNTANVQLGDTVSVKGDGKNVSTSIEGKTIKVTMSDTPSFTEVTSNVINSNTVKSKTIVAGDTVTINNNGINMGDTKITNLHRGEITINSTDAVTGSQLYETENRISQLGGQVNRVGASAAALAGLHPLDFDPDDKWDFAAGYGNYKSVNAVAVGAYYRPNEDTMFSLGGSFGGGENMVNVGVSWKLGQKNTISRSRVSIAKDMLAMKNQIEVLTKKLESYESGKPADAVSVSAGAITFPDVPENHWAYAYVKSLADKGYLQGYPDGEFKGDRAMTRYEYAAIIYRALQNGAPSDGTMARSVDEFGPELVKVQNIDRFRVDRISGKDNDRNKVERVRINDKDNAAENDYRDVYGSRIAK